MTEAQLQALAAAHNGITGRRPDPRTVRVRQKVMSPLGEPVDVDTVNPDPTHIVTFGDGSEIRVMGVRDAAGVVVPGEVDVVDWGTIKPPSTSPTADVRDIPGRGLVRITPEGAVPVPGGEAVPPRAPIQSSSGTWWQQGEDGEMHMIGANPIEIQNQQQQANERAATAQRAQDAERRQGVQTQLNVIKAAQDAGEIDAKRAQELRDWLYKTQVEAPAKQLEQQDVLLGKGIERGRLAGEAAVSDITATLPYRYSPGFDARQTAVAREASRGNFLPGMYQSIARSYTGTDLRAARTGAETQYQNQYLTEFGFDQPAAPQAGYRVPSAGGAPPGAVPAVAAADVVDPDEEAIKALARQMAGG